MFSFIQSIFNHRPTVTATPASSAGPQASPLAGVMDDRGVAKTLGRELARGGEGTIHTVGDRPDVLVKIYHHSVLDDAHRSSRLARKIAEMACHAGLRNHDRLAWPLVPLYFRENNRWCGYAMRLRPGVSLRQLCGNPRNLAMKVPHWHRQHLVRLCLDFLDTIDALAIQKTLPVDFNPSNFLVNTEEVRMGFIDCDGFQFAGASGMHLSQALLPEMAAPEIMSRSRNQDMPIAGTSLRFSVGMTLFYILNVGNSPYRHRNGNDPVSNLIHGHCALGKGSECEFPKGSAYLIWSHLIFDLKNLFIRCFREGHADPAARPSNAEWREALLKYNHCLVRRHADASIMPAQPKSTDFRAASSF